MSDWMQKIKGLFARAEQEFTVLEGVDGVDPLDHRADDVLAHDAETAETTTEPEDTPKPE